MSSLAFALVCGTLTGLLIRLPFFETPKVMFNDGEYFHVESEEPNPPTKTDERFFYPRASQALTVTNMSEGEAMAMW